MHKAIFAIALLTILFSASAFADNVPPVAMIANVSEEPVTEDIINIRCWDPDRWSDEDDWKCVSERWYYFSADPCSEQKDDYTEQVQGEFGQSWVSVRAECPETGEAYPYNYLCLWVEDQMGLSDWEQSPELLIDCVASETQIISPTTLAPETRSTNSSVDVVFNVSDPSPASYTVEISNILGQTICSGSNSISSAGQYTFNCSWGNISDGAYTVDVTVLDSAGNESSDTEAGALIIASEEAPRCQTGRGVYMLGNRETGIDNAFNLNDVCTDPEGDDIDYRITDRSDCTQGADPLVDSVTIDGSENVDVGTPQKNGEIVEWSETCQVQYSATDATGRSVDSYFNITVFKTGELEIRMRYPAATGEITDFDLDIAAEPGQEVCFDIIVRNNISPLQTGKPLDLLFVLDASGSMQTEIDSVKNTIDEVTDFIITNCEGSGIPDDECFRLGVVIMEGYELIRGRERPLNPWQIDFTTDTDSVRNLIARTIARGGAEPWADYIINTIQETPGVDVYRSGVGWVEVDIMSWRGEDVTKLIIVISDASQSGQSRRNYVHTDIVDYTGPLGIIVSGLGMDEGMECDPAGCSINELSEVALATGGEAYVYDRDEEDIKDKIMDLIIQTIEEDDVLVIKTDGPNWATYEGNPFPENIELKIVRGQSAEVNNVCISVPLDADNTSFTFEIQDPTGIDSYDQAIVNVTIGVLGTVQAVIAGPNSSEEGTSVSFNASGSSSDAAIVLYEWNYGDGEIGSGQTVSHTFANNGSYNVSLTVTDSTGVSDTATHLINVSNVAPTGYIESFANVVLDEEIPLNAVFDDPGDDSLVYDWDFGDGGTGNGEEVTHSWSQPGWYTVTVTVSDGDSSSIATKRIRAVTYSGDVIAIRQFKTLNEGEDSASFYLDEDIEIVVSVESVFVDPVSERSLPIRGTIVFSIIDPDTLAEVSRSEEITTFDPSGEVQTHTFTLSSADYEEKNYIVRVDIRQSGLEETYLENNSKQRIISVNASRGIPVPEMSFLLVPLIAFAVLFLVRRKRT